MEAVSCGRLYWCVKTPLSKDRQVFLYADRVELREGALIFWGRFYPSKGEDGLPDYDNPEGEERIWFVFNKDKWKACYIADEGQCPVAVEHWKGEFAWVED